MTTQTTNTYLVTIHSGSYVETYQVSGKENLDAIVQTAVLNNHLVAYEEV